MQALLSVCMQDEEAELLAELERIKKEREEVASKRAAEEASAAASSLQEELIRGNPLIIGKFDKSADFQVRCRIGAYFERNLDILLLTRPIVPAYFFAGVGPTLQCSHFCAGS
jgi:hypothetical protein